MPDETKPDDNNMRIWDAVFQVPEGATKPINDGRGLTAIAPMALYEQATKLWGPIGKGWGFEIVNEGFVHLDSPKRPEDALHVMTIKLWYDGAAIVGQESARGSEDGRNVNIVMDSTYGMGCTKLFQVRGGKPYIDDDFNKSTLTDAITNALSRLGFGGSVRLGEMQSKYTTNLDAKDSELEDAWVEYCEWRRDDVRILPVNEDMNDIMLIEEGVNILRDNSRSVTAANVRSLMK